MNEGHDGTGQKKLDPHDKLFLETPFLHVLFEPVLFILKPIMRVFYAMRWGCLQPLNASLIPLGLPYLDAPGLRWLSFVSIGQCLLALPIFALVAASAQSTFFHFNLAQSGKYCEYTLMLTFLTASKSNGLCSLLFGIPFPKMVGLHSLAAVATLTNAIFHAYCAYHNGGPASHDYVSETSLFGGDPDLLAFLCEDTHNLSGLLMVLSMAGLIGLTKFPFFRQKFFDLWLWTHIGLAFCTILFCVLHKVTLIIIIGGWWGADLFMRYVVMASCRYPQKASITKIEPDVVKLSFPKPDGFIYNAGQFVQISVPDLGILAFHPISISSAPHEPNVTLHIKACGGWSNSLLELARKYQEVKILMEGPYGCLEMNIDDDARYSVALCVSGGIGVTHCQSIAKSLLHEHVHHGRSLKHLRFVWAVRDVNMLQVMAPLEAISVDVETLWNANDKSTSGVATRVMENDTCIDVETMDSMDEKMGSTDDKTASRVGTCVVENDIYVTGKSASTDSFSRTIYQGRPNFDAIVAKAKQDGETLGVSHVAVFACGPAALVEQLKVTCRTYNSQGGVRMDVHHEVFGM